MPDDTLGSRRARARPPKREEKKGKWKKRMVQLVAIILMILMAFSTLIAFIANR